MLHLCPNPARQYATLPVPEVLHNPGLSPIAVGLLTKLMNAPANTSTDPKALALQCGTSRRVVKYALRELRAAGLLLPTAVRRPSGREVTLICDDPDMLCAELARLNAGGWLDLTALPVAAPIVETRAHQPRQAWATAATARPQRIGAGGRVEEDVRSERTRQEVGEHGERYHYCTLRTTHVYMNSHLIPAVASTYTGVGPASNTQDAR